MPILATSGVTVFWGGEMHDEILVSHFYIGFCFFFFFEIYISIILSPRDYFPSQILFRSLNVIFLYLFPFTHRKLNMLFVAFDANKRFSHDFYFLKYDIVETKKKM